MRKKVLWVNHFVPFPAKGGVTIRTNGLLKEVAKQHDVTLVCLIQPKLITPFFKTLEEGLDKAKEYFESSVVEFHTCDMPSQKSRFSQLLTVFQSLFTTNPYSVNWLKSKSLREKLKALLASNQYDLIHIDTMGLLENLPDVSPETKVIINHHNAEHVMMERRALKAENPLERFYFNMEAKKIAAYDKAKMSKFKLHIACSDGDSLELKNLGGEIRCDLIPNGVVVKDSIERQPIVGKLLFVGGLDWYPNTDAIEYLLEYVCPKLAKMDPKPEIDIVGKNPSAKMLELEKAYDFLQLHGFVDDISTFYKEARGFLCLLRDGGGTKLKVLDAMAMGVPVIGTDIAFEGIDVTDNVDCFHVDINDIDSVIEKVMDVAYNSQDIGKVGSAGRTLIDLNYNSTKISQRYANLISELCD